MNTDNGSLAFDFYLDNGRLQQTALEAERRIKGLTDTAINEGKRAEGSFDGVAKTLAAIGGTAFLLNIGKQIIDTTGQFQQLNIAFETMLGNKEKADALMNNAVEFAAKTPFTLTDVATNIKQLLAMGIESDNVMGTLKSLGDVAAGLSVPMSQLAVNYGQVATQGKLTGRELRDFSLAGVPLIEELAKNLGKTKTEIQDMVSTGDIGFAQVEAAFVSMSSEGGKFFDLMEKQSLSVTGQISNLSDKFQVMLNDIGSANTGLISGGINGLASMVENYEAIGETIIELVAIYGTYKATLMTLSAVQSIGNSVSTTAETQSLKALLSVQQQEILAKSGMTAASAQYQLAVKNEIAANTSALSSEAQRLAIQVNIAEQEVISSRIIYASKKQKIAILREELLQETINYNSKEAKINVLKSELATELLNNDAKKASTIQTKIDTATVSLNTSAKKASKIETELDTAITTRNALARDLRSKKILVETVQEQAQTAAKAVNTLATEVQTAASVGNVTATNILAAAKVKLIAIEKALNAAMAANPWTLAAIGVAALATGIYYLTTQTNDAEKAQNRLKETFDESKRSIESERIQIDSLFARLKAAKKGTEEYQAAKDAIQSKYGGYLSKLGDEANALNNVALAYKTISEEAAKAARARALEASTKESSDVLALEQGNTKEKLKKLLDQKFGKDSKKSLEVFYELTPLIDAGKGSDAINKEFAKKFDVSKSIGGGGGSAVGSTSSTYSYIQNDLKNIIDDAKKAKEIFNDVNKDALFMFGEAPKKESLKDTGKEAANVIINAKYWEEQVKSAKDSLDSLDTNSKTYSTDRKKILNDILQGETELDRIRGKKKKEPKSTQLKDENTYLKDKLDNERKAQKEEEELIKKGIETKIKLYDDEIKQTGITFERENELSQLRIEEKKKLIDLDLKQTMKGIDDEEKEFIAKAKKAGIKNPDLSSFKSLRDSATSKANADKSAIEVVNTQEEKEKLNSLLSQFQDMKRQMVVLENEYNNDIKRLNSGILIAKTEEEKIQITQSIAERKKQFTDDKNKLSIDELMQSPDWKKLFGNLDTVTTRELIKLKDKVEDEFNKMDLKPEELDVLRNKIKEITGEIQQRNPFLALSEAVKKYKADSSNVNFKELMSNVGDSIQAVGTVFDQVNGSLDKLGVKTSEQDKQVLADISGMLKGAGNIAKGLASGNPMEVIQGSIDLISNGIDLIAGAKDRKLERSITRHREQVEALKVSYQDLERVIDKALGSGRYSSQKAIIDNLKSQQAEYAAMTKAERDKKKTDNDKLKEYESAVKDNLNAIQDTINKMREDILGMDVSSAANELGGAIIDAFSAGEDAAQAWGNKVNDIVGDVIRKMLIQKLVEEPVGNIINKYMAQWVDSEGNFLGFDSVMNTALQMGNELSAIGPGLSAALSALPDDIKKYITGNETGSNESKTALSGAIKGVSEDTAGVISGQLNAMRISQADSISVLRQQLISLSQIEVNTRNLNGILNAMNTLVNGGRAHGLW